MELTCVDPQLAGNQRRYQLNSSGCCPVLLDVLCTADPGDLQAHTHAQWLSWSSAGDELTTVPPWTGSPVR